MDYPNYKTVVNHYTPYFSTNREKDKYEYLEKYLDYINIVPLSQGTEPSKIIKANNIIPQFTWEPGNQNFRLSHLIPGTVYRINYSYFPYWHTNDGILMRGSMERMYFIPYGENAEFSYTKLYSASTWIGWLLTVLGILYICSLYNLIRLNKCKGLIYTRK